VTFGFEVNHFGVEFVDQLVDAFQVVLLESFKLLFGFENFNELENPPFEDIKFPEDLGLREIEVGTSRKRLNFFFNFSIFFLIFLVEFDAVVEHQNEFLGFTFPNFGLKLFFILFVIFGVFFFLFRFMNHSSTTNLFGDTDLKNIFFTVSDHLVGNFLEQVGHGSCTRIVTGNSMNHLDGIHQSGESFNDGNWGALVQGFDELFEDTKIFDVVLSLI